MKNKQYYDIITVSKSSGVKKKLKDRASEMGMSLTDMLDHLLLLTETLSESHVFKDGDGVVIVESGIMGEVYLTNGRFLKVKLSDGNIVSKQTHEVKYCVNYPESR